MSLTQVLIFSTTVLFVGAVWKPYTINSGAPKDGFIAGVNEFGKDVYVGRGTVSGQMAPGKLMVEATSHYSPGFYMEHTYKEHLIVTGVEYYAKEPDCDYSWVPSSKGQTVENAIGFTSSSYTFYVGRITAFNSVQVGKVTLQHRVMYYGHNGKGYNAGSYEVLVCTKVCRSPEELNEALRSANNKLERTQIELDHAWTRLVEEHRAMLTCHFDLNHLRQQKGQAN